MRTTTLFIVIIVLQFCSSCKVKKEPQRNSELIETVKKIQARLPVNISEGLKLTDADYKDTLFVIQFEIDEKYLSFDDLVKNKKNRKELFLAIVSSSTGDGRESFEQCSQYGIAIKFIFIGKHSHKEMNILILPEEINQALKIKRNPIEVLELKIAGERNSLPLSIGDGMMMTEIEMRDSNVYVKVVLDEEKYQFDGIEHLLEEGKTEIAKSMTSDRLGANFVKTIVDVHFGLVFSYIGSISGKNYNIVFLPEELLLINEINEGHSDIVECDV